METKPGHEPIAVIGMSCRFPRANSPEDFWKLLEDGVDTVSEVPEDRWDIDRYYDPNPAAPGRMSTRYGAFIDGVDQFDAQFFGITPREATRLDPQHRLLMEVSWEALENAGLAPDRLAGSDTAVFAGITTNDYAFLQVPDLEGFNGHAGMGGGHCIATGRLSYFYDFHGPNAAVDTACSSSMVAVHLACQSLRAGECSLALAGGVNVMVIPHMTVFLSEWGVLAPDGRSKAFADTADGFGRGEGCGFVVLKLLRDAQEAGDQILAVIRGTAMNQDGRGTRLSASNAAAQVTVLRKALADGGVDPSTISFVEAHGTGTPIGDPIEVEALTEVIGQPRSPENRCALGSVKANVGHLEAAAGVAGLMKAVLCLQHRRIPRQLHVERLNPAIHLENTPFFVPRETVDWPEGQTPRRAGVSSFGLSGTNTHVIVEEAPAPPERTDPTPRPELLALSAQSATALRETVERFRKFLNESEAPVADICHSAATRRSHHSYRVAVVGSTHAELAERLGALGDQDYARPPVIAGLPERLAMVFSGQGSQWKGMALDLLDTEPVFLEQMKRCDKVFRAQSGISLLKEIRASDKSSRLDDTEVAQPAIFAVQVSLLALYESWGIRPDAVVGHSAGEVTAAYAAGIFDLEDAMKIMYHRSRLMQKATGMGRMAAIALTEQEAEAAIAAYHGRLEVAGLNGPALTVVAGDPEPLADLLESLKETGTFCRDLGVNYAFHTRQMEPYRQELEESLKDLAPRKAAIQMISTVTGSRVEGPELDAAHWSANIRRPVRFAEAAGLLIDDELTLFLEVGPHPVLGAPLSQCLKEAGTEGTVVASLRKGQDGRTQLLKSVAALYVRGNDVDLGGLSEPGRQAIRLPNYPWQHRRHWLPTNLFHRPPASPSEVLRSPAPSAKPEQQEDVISSFYDRVSESAEQDEAFLRLTFAPFLQVEPGFSWMRAFYQIEEGQHFKELTKQAHEQMRQVLFRGIDFDSVTRVLDIGCGYGTDLISLASRYSHLAGDGYTLSPKQAELGNRRARQLGVQDRVSLFTRDSAADEFPHQYDLAMGFEVVHYIRDKDRLFAHIDRHLNAGGYLVLADFIANTVSEIRHEATNSFFPTLEQWCDLLAQHKLRVIDCVDVSQEMANFLHDPDSEQNLRIIEEKMGTRGAVREHFASYDGLGKLFRKQLAIYGLFSIQKDRLASHAEILRINRERLENRVAYREALERLELAPAAEPPSSLGELTESLYELKWEAQPGIPAPAINGQVRTAAGWLIFADGQGIGEALAEEFSRRGDSPILIRPGQDFQQLGPRNYRINPLQPGNFIELLSRVEASGLPAPKGVVHLWGVDARPPQRMTLHSLETDQRNSCGSVLHLVQAIAGSGMAQPKLWIVTRGAHSLDGANPVSVAQGALWGLGRTIAWEQPSMWGGLCDLEPSMDAATAARHLVDELVSSQVEDQILWSRGHRCVARLRKNPRLASSSAIQLSPDASYLVTGGLGGLGSTAARAFADHGARNLILVGRSTTGPDAEALVKELQGKGANVYLFEADVSREEDLGRVLTAVRDLPPLRGVVHAAGVLEDGIVTQQHLAGFDKVMKPKVSGAWNLHRGTLSDPLDFFVMFSSVAAVLGSPGQANYTAANAGLDALAQFRAWEALPALSISWGPWLDVGMAAAQANRGERAAAGGIAGFSPAEGASLLMHLIGQKRPLVSAMHFDVLQLRRTWPRAASMPLLAELPGGQVPAAAPDLQPPTVAAPAAGILQSLRSAEGPERSRLLDDYLRRQTAAVLQLSVADVDARQPLNRMGIDSLMSVELRNHIESELQVNVPLVSFLEGDSLADLARAILPQLVAAPEEDALERAMEQIEQMSDEEVEALLAKKRQQLAP